MELDKVVEGQVDVSGQIIKNKNNSKNINFSLR